MRENKLSTAERHELALSVQRLCYQIVRCECWRARRDPLLFEELAQAGMLGATEAARRFNPKRIGKDGQPLKFSTYAGHYIRSRIQVAMAKALPPGGMSKVYETVNCTLLAHGNLPLQVEGDMEERPGRQGQVAQSWDVEDWGAILYKAGNQRTQFALYLRYVERMRLADIAVVLGLSTEGARQVVYRGINKLREAKHVLELS